MAIKSLTYYDIPEDVRREAALKSRAALKTLLANSSNTPEQRTALLERLTLLSKWEANQLPIEGVQAPPVRTPVNHFVGVSDNVNVEEN